MNPEVKKNTRHATGSVVFVVDDDVFIREALSSLIRSTGIRVVTFSSASEFLREPLPEVPACLVLDVNLPGMNGMELQRELARKKNDIPIIFITGHGDIPMSVRAMKAGAVEFLTKPFTDDALLSAVRQALDRSRIALDQDAELQKLRDCYESLSAREQQVMSLVVSGLLNKQVGGELGISEITVKVHRRRVMEKMKADSFAELVEMAARLRVTRARKA